MIVAFLTPAVVLFICIFLYPIIRTVIMSFFKIEGVTDPMSAWSFVGIDNYVKLMNTSLFRTAFYNLFRIWLIGGIIVLLLSLLLQQSYPAASVSKNCFAPLFICLTL